MASIAEKLTAKEDRLISIKDRLVEIKGLIEDADEEVTADVSDEVDALSSEEASVLKSIDALQKIEAGLAAKAKANASPAFIKTADLPRGSDNADALFKSLTAQFVAHATKSNPVDVAGSLYSGDDRVSAIVKAKTPAASTTDAGWASELVQQGYGAFLEDLRGVSVFAALRAQSQTFSFNGLNSIKVPRRDLSGTHGKDLAGSFVGELGVIPVQRATLQSQTLNAYKMAVISVVSEEIMAQSTPSIEAMIRKGMIDDTAEALDAALLDNVALAAGIRPAGLMNGVTATASAGATSADIITDIKVLLTAMSTANLGAKPVIVMNTQRLLGLSTVTNAVGQFAFRDETASGRLLGIPVVASTHVPAASVLIVDADSFVSASSAPEFKISDQTVLTMADAGSTAPSQAGAKSDYTAGALGTAGQVPPKGGIIVGGDTTGAPTGGSQVGYQAMSMYQQAAVSIRMIMPLSWATVRPNSVAAISGAAW